MVLYIVSKNLWYMSIIAVTCVVLSPLGKAWLMVYADYHCPDQMVSLLAVMARSRGIKFEAGLITERMSVLDHYYKVYYD